MVLATFLVTIRARAHGPTGAQAVIAFAVGAIGVVVGLGLFVREAPRHEGEREPFSRSWATEHRNGVGPMRVGLGDLIAQRANDASIVQGPGQAGDVNLRPEWMCHQQEARRLVCLEQLMTQATCTPGRFARLVL